MQMFGVLVLGVSLVGAYLMDWNPLSVPQEMRDQLARNAMIRGVLAMLSYVLIGLALRRRQKWGAYAAIATIGIPAIIRFVWTPSSNLLSTVMQIGAVTTITLIISVWNELGTVFESEFVEDGAPPAPTEPPTRRNRGYGEPRPLSEPNPISTSAVANTPLPINNPRAN